MKIIYNHRTRGINVEGVHIREVIKALLKQGHEVKEVCLPGCNAINNQMDHENFYKNKQNIPIFNFISRQAPEIIFEILEIIGNFYIYFNLKRTIQTLDSINLIYERYSLFTFAGVLAAKRYNIPIILEVNDATSVERIRKLKLKKIATLLEQYIFQNVDAIVTISTVVMKKIVNSGISQEKITVIPNAADTDVFSLEIASDEIISKYNIEEKTVVGYCGGMDANQGMDFFFELIDEIVSKRKDVVFLIVGDNKKLDSKWQRFIENRTEIIKMAGRVSHNNVAKYIAAFDIAVLPNSHNYGSPVKIFEYMAMGKAVLVPKLPPMEDVISDGIQGLFFTPGDKNDFKNKIIQLIDNKQLRIQLGKAALESIKSHHTWEKNIERILAIYKNMIFKRGSSPKSVHEK